MSNLFLPKDQKSFDEVVPVKKKFSELEDDVFVFASDEQIFALVDKKKLYLLAEREKNVLDLCFHNGKLYDCGDYFEVFDTMADRPEILRRGPVMALCSHGGDLYDVEYFEDTDLCSISHPPSDSTQVLDNYISALCSYDGWVHCGASETIFKPFWAVDQPNYRRKPLVTSLCVHEGVLYDGGYGGVFETINETSINERASLIRSLCSYEGNLYASCNSGEIFDVFSDEDFFVHDDPVQAICSVPRKFLEDYL